MKHKFTPTKIIALGFLIAIILGTLLLMLPVMAAEGVSVNFIDALFTATSSVCVTGLLTIPNYSSWSFAGQLVILILIEVGGLGLITFTTLTMIIFRKRIGLKERILIQNAYNLNSMTGIVRMVKRIFTGTLIVQLIGAVCYMLVFIPEYGASGIWKSIFNSVSAFCNAGMDILGPDSLMRYTENVWINIVTMILIILGGIGFPVWWYFVDSIKERRKAGKYAFSYKKRTPLFVKMALFMTVVLIALGALVTFIMEYNNPSTIGELSLGGKILASLFQSVTWRTAGFATISQAALKNSTIVFGCILMFIGGCPSGTAGGIKTTTIMILIATGISMLRERADTEIFKRKINDNIVRRAFSILMVSFGMMLLAIFFICSYENARFVDLFYETISALGTVGLSRDLTPNLGNAGKVIIMLSMYIGRIGPISLAMFFNSSSAVNKINYVEEDVSVG